MIFEVDGKTSSVLTTAQHPLMKLNSFSVSQSTQVSEEFPKGGQRNVLARHVVQRAIVS